jgi:hypothetical protein
LNSGELPDGKLQEIAQRLGARAAEQIDVEAVSRVVLERLRTEPRSREWTWIRSTWVRIAAAVVVLLGGAAVVRVWWWAERPLPARALATIPVGADLSGLSAAELQELLAGLDQTLNLAVPLPSDSDDRLEELTEEQLRTMLELLEG